LILVSGKNKNILFIQVQVNNIKTLKMIKQKTSSVNFSNV